MLDATGQGSETIIIVRLMLLHESICYADTNRIRQPQNTKNQYNSFGIEILSPSYL